MKTASCLNFLPTLGASAECELTFVHACGRADSTKVAVSNHLDKDKSRAFLQAHALSPAELTRVAQFGMANTALSLAEVGETVSMSRASGTEA